MDVKTDKEIKREVNKACDEKRHQLWVVSYIIAGVVCLAVYFLLEFHVFGLLGNYRLLLRRLALAGIVVPIVFIVTRTIEQVVSKSSQTKKISYKSPNNIPAK